MGHFTLRLPDTNIQQQRNRFNALLEQLGSPDRDATRTFLAAREIEEPEDLETAVLIAKVEAKIVEVKADVV